MAMRIEPHTIRLAELFEGYRNDGENGAVAYGGRLIAARHISVNLYINQSSRKR